MRVSNELHEAIFRNTYAQDKTKAVDISSFTKVRFTLTFFSSNITLICIKAHKL